MSSLGSKGYFFSLILLSLVATVPSKNNTDLTNKLGKAVVSARGQGHSQQYHYAHNDGQSIYAGLSFDLSTGVYIAVGVIVVLLVLAAIFYRWYSKGGGYGWRRNDEDNGDYWTNNRNYSGFTWPKFSATTTEKILSAIETLYKAYGNSSKNN